MSKIVLVFAYAIILFLLVRPGSKGPSLVGSAGSALSSVIKAGTGGGGAWASGR